MATVTISAEVHIQSSSDDSTIDDSGWGLSTTDTNYTTDVPAFATKLYNDVVAFRNLGGTCSIRFVIGVGADTQDPTSPQEQFQDELADSAITQVSDITNFIDQYTKIASNINTGQGSGY